LRFCPLASGSSGNSAYVGAGGTHILIDAGISGKSIEAGLSELGLEGRQLSAILVTHEHSDHIVGVGVMSRRYELPIYASPKTWRYFDRHGVIGAIEPHLARRIEPGQMFEVGSLQAVAFDVPHDASQPVGYSIFAGGRKITVVTDAGEATSTIRNYVSGSDIVLLESNHDLDMLKNGKYPQALKRRILGPCGHLSNKAAGMLLTETATEKMRYVYLGHLSEENNRPLVAFGTVEGILYNQGILPQVGLQLIIAQRHGVSAVIEL